MNKSAIAWDLDYTVLYPDPKLPGSSIPRLDQSRGVILNPLLEGCEEKVDCIVTGRPESERESTIDLLLRFGIEADLYMNPKPEFSQHHIATMKAEYLHELDAIVYVEDNGIYRNVMRKYASDIQFVDVQEALAMINTKIRSGEKDVSLIEHFVIDRERSRL